MSEDIPQEIKLKIPGTIAFLDRIRNFISGHAKQAGFSNEDVDAIVLSMDEAVANIIEHAYSGSRLPEAEQTIAIVVKCSRRAFSIRISDRGEPFNPTLAPEVDLDEHLAEFRTGGLGVHFMRRLMDKIGYEYIEGEGNVLELVKKIKT